MAITLHDLRRDRLDHRGRALRRLPPRHRAAHGRAYRRRRRSCRPLLSSRRASSRSRCRRSSSYQTSSFMPNVVGSANTPCVRPIVRCLAMLDRSSANCLAQAHRCPASRRRCGIPGLDCQTGVDDVRTGQAEVNKSPMRRRRFRRSRAERRSCRDRPRARSRPSARGRRSPARICRHCLSPECGRADATPRRPVSRPGARRRSSAARSRSLPFRDGYSGRSPRLILRGIAAHRRTVPYA